MIRRNGSRWSLLGVATLLLLFVFAGRVAAADPAARAVFFYSPSCPHCHTVMDEVFPPLQARYGSQLQIVQIDVSQPAGQTLYQAAITAFNIPDNRLGVPTLVFGETVMVGSGEIPAMLPGLIEQALAAGGNAWPTIPGIEPVIAAQVVTTEAGEVAVVPPTEAAVSPFQRDPLGNSIAVLMLLLMAVSVFVLAITTRPPFDRPLQGWRNLAVPILAVAGIVVSAYLAFVEVSGAEAVCGPVGDCNAVQQSVYATFLGIPVGVLGVAGYAFFLVAWLVYRFGAGQAAHYARLSMPLMAFGGTIFSIYLTFLEPFVIGATCMWCIASAAIMTGLLWVTTPRGAPPVQRGRGKVNRRPVAANR